MFIDVYDDIVYEYNLIETGHYKVAWKRKKYSW